MVAMMGTPANRALCLGLATGAAVLATAVCGFAQEVIKPTEDVEHSRARLATSWARSGQPMPADQEQLDQMVRETRFVDLAKRLQSADTVDAVHLDLNWEQARIFAGGGFLLALNYTHDLWRSGISAPPPVSDELKRAAGMMLIYTFSLVEIDGTQCGDPTAPRHRIEQLAQQGRPILAYVKSLPRDQRMKLGTAALTVEAATAPVRGKDEVLCRDGLQQMMANSKALGDNPAPEMPCPPGVIGTCKSIPDDPNFRVPFLPARQWKPKQTEVREKMPTALTQMLADPNGAAGAPAPANPSFRAVPSRPTQ